MSGTIITAKEIIAIIKAASSSGVSALRIGEFSVAFDTNFHPNNHKTISHKDVMGEDEVGQPPGPTTSDDQKTDDEFFLQEELDQMSIEDPAAFEEFQLKKLNKGEDN
jgi:hypothetical protein